MKHLTTEAELLRVPLPLKTRSYSPVAHGDVINEVKDRIDREGLYISNESYVANGKGTQMIGRMSITTDYSNDFDFEIAFRNSYDKSMSVAFVAGATVLICSNGMVIGDTKFLRKHTGTVAMELNQKIKSVVNEQTHTMREVIKTSDLLKQVQIDETTTAELCGRFFMEQDIINSTQLNIIKRELSAPSYDEFEESNLWSLYNHVTHSLKTATPREYMDKHQNLHTFMKEVYYEVK